jgi:N-methylhydantoinase A
VDIGGTFTDFALYDERSGRLSTFKFLTSQTDPADGVIAGVQRLMADIGFGLDELSYLAHGTTIGLNTVLERNGASVALLVTEGFRDILELQRLRLSDPVNYRATRPEPVIPRWHVFEINERMLTNGGIDTPVDFESVARAIDAAVAAQVDAVVVCFINSFRNPRHEHEVASWIRERAPALHVSCSSDVWPQAREYERAIVSVLNAYIRPRFGSYADTLTDFIAERQRKAPFMITRSNGGAMHVASARNLPIHTMFSGPASGVLGAIGVAHLAGYENIISCDIGGTSADISVATGGRPVETAQNEVAGFPIVTPSISIHSIGAGGGSIAWVDSSGVLKVGPESARSVPGPACYGKGGKLPTLTDALLVAGYLGEGQLGSSQISLSLEPAEDAFSSLAEALSLSVPEVAEASIEIAKASLYAGVSQVIAQIGLDTRDYTLVAFGGAGPLFAAFVALEFAIPRVLVPESPGILCAFGALNADIVEDFVRSVHMTLDSSALESVARELKSLGDLAEAWVGTQQLEPDNIEVRLTAAMRYRHQAHTIDVPIEPSFLEEQQPLRWADAFHSLHRALYAHADPKEAVEVVDLHARVVGHTPKPIVRSALSVGSHALPSSRILHSGGHPTEVRVFRRAVLTATEPLIGPAIIEQADSTTFVPSGFAARLDRLHNLLLESTGVGSLTTAFSFSPELGGYKSVD